MPPTGAELLVEALVTAGVRHLFTLSGNQILPVYDATVGRDIGLIHTRHEAAAVHMADGWGRLTEDPGVALVTAGPGHLNALSALYTARMAESPVVLLSGHAPRGELGRGAFQEVDQVGTARAVTKAAWRVDDPARLGDEVRAALALARAGRPGPVHLSLPGDVLEARVEATPRDAGVARSAETPVADAAIRAALDLLAAATRPLVLLGPAMGRPQRRADVDRLTEVTGIPALLMESPRGVNDPALRAAGTCLGEADVVLLLGKRLDYSLRFGEAPPLATGCRFVQVDSEAGRPPFRIALGVLADPSAFVRQLTAAARERAWPASSWAREVEAARRAEPAEWAELGRSSRQPIHPLRVCAALQPKLAAGAVFVSDGGEFGQWAQAALDAPHRLINGLSGSIGSGLSLALGARLACPDRPVLVTLGDGTFGYHALEFDTALRYALPIVAIVGNDARWNAEHQLQLRQYGPERAVGCTLLPSRYDRLVDALGGHGEFVEHPQDLEPALERALGSGRPACLNILIEGLPAPAVRAGASGH
ncbi:MAG TPA: thiamine pyrophosphate-binding protein [Methylomirabilota bacterium]|nr:thiamine pyrophosphate-binding protein [Methylomirabilota bacterium]